jgi:diaminohydroxyphosphoribosylaminopyrimidine deaminase / 5-amino-6-(5-phosphoribosylamino)uracil reductase
VTQLKPDPEAHAAENAGHGRGPPPSPGEQGNAASWPLVPSAIRLGGALPPPWEPLFGPIRTGNVDDLIVVGQFGQSLDGRVATETGHSHYINGVDGLAHLHRLRAVVDAVVVGIGTALADDPQLTVRRVAGPSPARVVIDPHGRLPATARLLAADGARRLVVIAEGSRPELPDDVERLTLAADRGAIAPAAILAGLARCGFRRILIEGGANTVSRFLVAGCLDRLHVVVAPMILGTGKPSFTLPQIDRVDRALRPPMRTHLLGDEVLFDCDLSAQRLPVGVAKKST